MRYTHFEHTAQTTRFRPTGAVTLVVVVVVVEVVGVVIGCGVGNDGEDVVLAVGCCVVVVVVGTERRLGARAWFAT